MLQDHVMQGWNHSFFLQQELNGQLTQRRQMMEDNHFLILRGSNIGRSGVLLRMMMQ